MLLVLLILLLPLALSYLFLRWQLNSLRSAVPACRKAVLENLAAPQSSKIVGFFHPYCNAGGGGERVLWTAIKSIQEKTPDIVSVVYSGDIDATKEEIIAKVQSRFAITLNPSTLHFVFLRRRYLVEDAAWPRFTLLGQSLGSVMLAWEAMWGVVPHVYIDTMGYAFTFPAVRLFSGKEYAPRVGAYVHYPTVSTDMMKRVSGQWGKLIYYALFMHLYSHALSRAAFLMANSSWTKNHVDGILNLPPFFPLQISSLSTNKQDDGNDTRREARIVYPPCDTRAMADFPLEGRENIILSVAQFRPEKNHALQIRAFARLVEQHAQLAASPNSQDVGDTGSVRLVLLGGARNAEDMARVDALKALAKEFNVESRTSFVLNAPYPEMLSYLARASVGLSTMIDEHFGINVVEYMASGLIPVVHASGGPLHDIVVPSNGEPTGFHATDPDTFAAALHEALTLPPAEESAMRARARSGVVERFGEAAFIAGWEAGVIEI